MFVFGCMLLSVISGGVLYTVMERSAPRARDRDWDGALKVAGVPSALDKVGMVMPGLLTTSSTTVKWKKDVTDSVNYDALTPGPKSVPPGGLSFKSEKMAGVPSASDKVGMTMPGLLVNTSPTEGQWGSITGPDIYGRLLPSAVDSVPPGGLSFISEKADDTPLSAKVVKHRGRASMQWFMPPAGPIKRKLRPAGASRRNILATMPHTSPHAVRRQNQKLW